VSPTSEATTAVAWNPSREHLVHAANDGVILTFDIRNLDTAVSALQVSEEEVGCIDINNAGKYLAAGDDDGSVHLVDLVSGKLLRTLKQAHSNICSGVKFRAHKPQEVLTGGMDCR
jgi:WD40 repeat protein